MHEDLFTFQDGRMNLSVDADGMAYVQTVTRIPLNHLRQVIVGIYSSWQRLDKPAEQGEHCPLMQEESCED